MTPTLCACSIAWRGQPLASRLRDLAAWGFDGVEAWGPHLDQLDDAGLDALRTTAAGLGLAIPVVSPYFFLTRDLPELLERSFATAERSVHQARRLGATRIRTFCDAGPDGVGSASADEMQWQRAVDALRRITALAPDLLFTVETHPNTLADTATSTRRLLDAVGAANLKVLFQPGAGDAVADFQALRSDVHHVHLYQVRHGGHGYLDDGPDMLRPFLGQLGCYAGTISIEYCWPDADADRLGGGLSWLRQELRLPTSQRPVAVI
jgi:3-dehydroshikimate dehydratase